MKTSLVILITTEPLSLSHLGPEYVMEFEAVNLFFTAVDV